MFKPDAQAKQVIRDLRNSGFQVRLLDESFVRLGKGCIEVVLNDEGMATVKDRLADVRYVFHADELNKVAAKARSL